MPGIIAVTCVVESSLALAAEWSRVKTDYIDLMLRRLKEVPGNPTVRLGFVSYGPQNTYPTPVLSKIFFSPPENVEDGTGLPRGVGLGHTSNGGGYGMAALEGLVAALELFDTLRSSVEVTGLTCHVIHIATTPPDPAERPMWNVSPSLDSVTWDTVPAELKKRGIHYSNVLLRQIPRLTQLHAATASNVQNPWFPVRAPHVVLLSGFPQKGTKRSGGMDRSPEMTKRVKVQALSSPVKSPATIPPATHSSPQQPPPPTIKTPAMATITVPAPSTNAPPFAAPAAPNSVASAPQTTSFPPQIEQRFRQVEAALRNQMVQVQALEKEGRMEAALQLRADLVVKMNKFKEYKISFLRDPAAAIAAMNAGAAAKASGGSSTAAEASRSQTATDLASKLPQNPPAAAPTAPGVQAVPSALSRSSTVQLPPNVPPEMAAQMQKLLEQKNRASHPGVQTQPQFQPQPQPQPQPQMQPQPAPSMSAGPEQVSGPGAAPSLPINMWQGTLSWRGTDSETHIRKDVHAQVVIHGQNAEVMRADSWPKLMSLAPSQHHAVPMPLLKAWLHRHKCVPLVILPSPQAQDVKGNEEHFRALGRLLIEKNLYALAAWDGPNQQPENRILLFVLKGNIAGAFFPLPGGMPELPKAEIGGIPLASLPPALAVLLSTMSPKDQAIFGALKQEQKMAYIKQLVQRTAVEHQQQQQRQQQQQQMPQGQPQQQQAGPSQPQPLGMGQPGPTVNVRPGEFNPWLPNNGPNVSAILGQFAPGAVAAGVQPGPSQSPVQQNAMLGMGFGAMGTMGGAGMGMGGMPQGPQGMHRRTPSAGTQGGVPAGLSYEMLQSFMQRSQEGGAGNPGLGGM
ncbi:hypothetical protein C8Q78DRAFT_303917 [Trametes maxima]|nr:hypothetical protein C8Q78DRAFT_303917 [Trametes maxima]